MRIHKGISENTPKGTRSESGFSLVELIVAMAVTLVLSTLAFNLLAASFSVRGRQDQKGAALADAQRAINIMTREIANAGFGLTNNGIVTSESNSTSIRVRANLNAYGGETTSNSVADADEDVKYLLYSDSTTSYVERVDINTGARTTVLANRVDALRIYYYADKVDYTSDNCAITTSATEVVSKSDAKYIVIVACVQLPAVGRPGSPGYQPPENVQLISDVMLRNTILAEY